MTPVLQLIKCKYFIYFIFPSNNKVSKCIKINYKIKDKIKSFRLQQCCCDQRLMQCIVINQQNLHFLLRFTALPSLVTAELQQSERALKYFFKKMGQPGLFFVYFWSFQTNIITIFTTNKCEKCTSSLRCQDSNPRPLECEPLPITTRPGLPPNLKVLYRPVRSFKEIERQRVFFRLHHLASS